MDRSSEYRGGLAVVGMAWLIGGGLLAAPAEIVEAIRNPLRDGLRPGQEISANVESALRQQIETARLGRTNDIAALERDRDRWRDRFLALQEQQAELRAVHITRAPAELSPQAVLQAEPLIVADLLPAHVLGSERGLLRERVSRMLDRGGTDGVAVDDVVLAGDLPLLDQGADAGVTADMTVAGAGCVVGRIRQCGRWTSTVQPVTHPDFRLLVQLVRPAPGGPLIGAEGILAGNGDSTCRLESIAATEPVSVGDYVYAPRVDGSPSLCIGQVIAAELSDGAEHWTVTVEPHAAIEDHDAVHVLRELPNGTRMAVR